MEQKKKELLKKLADAYDQGHPNSFDNTFYLGYDDAVINSLDAGGYIVAQDDILGTIQLTEFGYNEARK